MHDLNPIELEEIIDRALKEDLAGGDVTTRATVDPDASVSGRLLAKEAGVICGLMIFRQVLCRLDANVKMVGACHDGDFVDAGTELARVHGPAFAILGGERVALNFLQRLSGIATRTRQAVDEIKDSRATITDTRKTTPGLRMLEKYAVRVGGGRNHRFNLSDGILIKDNHIRAAGGIGPAIARARRQIPHTLKIEVEVETEDQIDAALSAGADIIMLDNMDLAEVQAAVRQIDGRACIEISGNMGSRNLAQLAATGVDLISIGALTHTVRALDISLRLNH